MCLFAAQRSKNLLTMSTVLPAIKFFCEKTSLFALCAREVPDGPKGRRQLTLVSGADFAQNRNALAFNSQSCPEVRFLTDSSSHSNKKSL